MKSNFNNGAFSPEDHKKILDLIESGEFEPKLLEKYYADNISFPEFEEFLQFEGYSSDDIPLVRGDDGPMSVFTDTLTGGSANRSAGKEALSLTTDGDRNIPKNPEDHIQISEETNLKLTFKLSDTGYNNSLGVYEINSQNKIINVQLLTENVKLAPATLNVTVSNSGNVLGFFIVTNGASHNFFGNLTEGEFQFINRADYKANGTITPATISDSNPLFVYNKNGMMTVIQSECGDSGVFHSTPGDGSYNLNGDGLDHVIGTLIGGSSLMFSFEDLQGGGDKDFNDVVFTVDIGSRNFEKNFTHKDTR